MERGWRGNSRGPKSGAAGNGWLLVVSSRRSLATPLANDHRPPTTDQLPKKLNILQVRASHSGETHGGI